MSKDANSTSDALSEPFLSALQSILQPIARAMIANGITVGAANEALKQALIAAASIPGPDGKRVTDSKISLHTGLHRKDVKRLRSDTPHQPKRPKLNAAILAVGVWSTQSAFIDKNGQPKPLTREEFDHLVRSSRIDLPPATVLTALTDQGAVSTDEENRFLLSKTAITGDENSETKLEAFEKNISTHLNVSTDNLIQNAGHFERAAHFNQLSDASIATLEAEARSLFQTALETIVAKALAKQDEDARANPDAQGRFSAGAYIAPKSESST